MTRAQSVAGSGEEAAPASRPPRLALHALAAVGGRWIIGDGWVRPERRDDRIEVWDETDEWVGDGQFSGSFGVGADWFLRPRFALVSDLAFRVLPGGPEVNDYARIVHDR